jgi:hypothetical protein
MQTCPIAARGSSGMDTLYSHVLKQSREVSQLKEELQKTQKKLDAMVDRAGQKNINVSGNNTTIVRTDVLNMTTVSNTVVFNVFGKEDTAHITPTSVRDILVTCGETVKGTESVATDAVSQALVKAALLIYSDPDQPGNITCYIPNKRDGNALVHGKQGWEILPVRVVLSPMAKKSLDLLFEKQPFDDRESMAKCHAALKALSLYESRLLADGAKDLRAVLIRNKTLLSALLSNLPVGSERALK